MELIGFIGYENAEELLLQGTISKLEFLTHSTEEDFLDFQKFCTEQGLEQSEQAAEDFFLKKEQIFEYGFQDGSI